MHFQSESYLWNEQKHTFNQKIHNFLQRALHISFYNEINTNWFQTKTKQQRMSAPHYGMWLKWMWHDRFFLLFANCIFFCGKSMIYTRFHLCVPENVVNVILNRKSSRKEMNQKDRRKRWLYWEKNGVGGV